MQGLKKLYGGRFSQAFVGLRDGVRPIFQSLKLSPTTEHAGYRSDIDGLRAIAILLVVGYHFYPRRVPAGFIGVDIFFVISGFLITKIIVKDFADGTFRLTHFFSRRILRLFPALIVVLLCLAAFCWLVFTSAEYMALGKHLAGSAVYVSNFFLWLEAGYFDEDALTKPLLHMWSLAIEEQYYLVWPVLLLALRRQLKWSFAVIILVAGVSFALNVFFAGAPNGFAFYMPFTRGWELLMGAALSYWQWAARQRDTGSEIGIFSTVRNPRISRWLRSQSLLASKAAPYLGVLLIVIALPVLDDETPYPGYAALLPAIGAFLLIAGQPASWLHRRILSHPLLVWVGLISYPLYLWHWPLLSVTATLASEFPSRDVRIVLLAMALFLAWSTCKLVEIPVRRNAGALTILGLLSGMLLIGASGALIYFGKGLPQRNGIAAFEREIEAFGEKLDRFNFSLAEYPDELCRKRFPGSGWCSFAWDRPATAALIGDSHAHQFYPGLAKVFSLRGENLALLGSAGCPPVRGIVSQFRDGADQCRNGNAFINRVAGDEAIQTVILAANWHLYIRGNRFTDKEHKPPYWSVGDRNDNSTGSSETIFRRQLALTLRYLLDSGKKIFLIKQIPELDFKPKVCLQRPRSFFEPRNCLIERERVKAYMDEYEVVLDPILAGFKDVVVLKSDEHMCNDAHCFAFVGENPLYRDRLHLSLFGSHYLARKWPLFREKR